MATISPDRKYVVYQHINLINNKRYIGITQQNIKKRWQNGFGYQTQRLFWRAIQKYGWNNFKHEVLFCNLTQKEAEMFEVELIKYYKSNNKKYGYNIASGGEHGNLGYIHSKEARQKISIANKGHIITDEHRQKLRDNNARYWLNKKRPQETINKLKQSHLGHFPSQETKLKMSISRSGKNNYRSRQVICVETNQIFDTLTQASREMNINIGSISLNCQNKIEHCKGLHFKYY